MVDGGGVIWIIVMTYICYRGIEVSARIQYGLLAIELVVLVVFSIIALFKVYTRTAESYSLTRRSPGSGRPAWTSAPSSPRPS